MNAIALLEADHQMVKKLLIQLDSTTERGVKTRSELFATIKGELTLHEIVEERSSTPSSRHTRRHRTSCSRRTRSTMSSTS